MVTDQYAHRQQPTSPGPTWQQELLDRLRGDFRFAAGLRRIHTWDAIPPMQALPRDLSEFSLGYSSSSSTGSTKRIPFTARDWEQTVAHRAECLAALGVRSGHVAAVLLPFGPWFSGDNIGAALLRLGAAVLPAGIYRPHQSAVARMMAAAGANVLITTPSVAWSLPHADLALKHLITVGERLSPELRSALRERFGIEPHALYAASEVILGWEAGQDEFFWDPERLHLEVEDDTGGIAECGIGDLLVTRRYGEAVPLLRYRLGDRVELLPDDDTSSDNGRPRFKYLGRTGHAFSLPGGVKVGRAQLERCLDDLGCAVHDADFQVSHRPAGTLIDIRLGCSGTLPSAEQVRERFLASSIDVADAFACGYVELSAQVDEAAITHKRRLRIQERTADS